MYQLQAAERPIDIDGQDGACAAHLITAVIDRPGADRVSRMDARHLFNSEVLLPGCTDITEYICIIILEYFDNMSIDDK